MYSFLWRLPTALTKSWPKNHGSVYTIRNSINGIPKAPRTYRNLLRVKLGHSGYKAHTGLWEICEKGELPRLFVEFFGEVDSQVIRGFDSLLIAHKLAKSQRTDGV